MTAPQAHAAQDGSTALGAPPSARQPLPDAHSATLMLGARARRRLVVHEPRRPQIMSHWPETATQRALRIILATHAARLWQLPPEPDISPWIALLEFHADIAAAVDSVDPDEVTLAGIRALVAR